MKLSVRYHLKEKSLRDVAQFGSAPRLGRGGRWFESSHPDIILYKNCGCNSVGRVSAFQADCREFESRRPLFAMFF